MILSDISIKRPVFAAVMCLVLVTLGVFSYRWLPIEMYPNVEIPVMSVITKFPGASPDSVEREVTKRIEEGVNSISGIKHIYSYSREGYSTVVVEFRLEEKLNDVTQEARAKINAIRGQLPKGIDEPVIQKLDFNAMPVISLAIQSPTLSPREMTVFVEKQIKRRLEGIPGVGKVDLVGASKREVNVVIRPEKLSALGLNINTLMSGLRSENVNTPLGRLSREGSEYNLRISGKPERVEGFGSMVIAQRSGRPVVLSEVADVIDGVEEQRSLALVNGVPAVSLDVLKQSGANIVEVVDAVRKTAAELQKEMPPQTTLSIVRDGSVFIRESLDDVRQTLLLGAIFTIFIVFLFINSWRSTVITGLTLPISVMSSFLIMKLMGMSLNMMTMMALSLAIGLLIDDAIVVRENIVRHLEQGEDHLTAAKNGTSEIGLAVLATTLSIVAVFVPVAFMKGHVGRFFFQFGITVSFAVLVSLFVSFTLDPMLSSRWRDPAVHAKGSRRGPARFLERFNDGFDQLADRYRRIIGWALDHRKMVLIIAFAAFTAGIGLFVSLESSFFPKSDNGEFRISFKTSPDASLVESRSRMETIINTVRNFPEVSHTYASIGAGDEGTVRSGYVYVKLKGKKDRERSQNELQQEVRLGMARIPGVITSIEEVDSMSGNPKPLLVNIRGADMNRLKDYASGLRDEMNRIPGIKDIEISLEHEMPEYRLSVDRERAQSTGVMTDAIASNVGALVGGEVVSTYEDEDGDAVDIRVRLPQELRRSPDQILNLQIPVANQNGTSILLPLANIVSYDVHATPLEINRQDLVRQVSLSANLDHLALGSAVEQVQKAAQGLSMAPGYKVVFSGESEEMVETFGYIAEVLVLAILFVYFILAAQFESFLEPLAIMLSLPLSIVGMAGMLFLTGDTLNIMSLIGLIMLMGLVTKNAILLVDYTKVLRRQGLDRREAVITAGRTRLRPIVMTTLSMIFGMLPLALAMGAGAEMRAPMARGIIGGLLTSTVLTLIVVPVVYTLVDDLNHYAGSRFAFRKDQHAGR